MVELFDLVGSDLNSGGAELRGDRRGLDLLGPVDDDADEDAALFRGDQGLGECLGRELVGRNVERCFCGVNLFDGEGCAAAAWGKCYLDLLRAGGGRATEGGGCKYGEGQAGACSHFGFPFFFSGFVGSGLLNVARSSSWRSWKAVSPFALSA